MNFMRTDTGKTWIKASIDQRMEFYKQDSPLLPSGLPGPATIEGLCIECKK